MKDLLVSTRQRPLAAIPKWIAWLLAGALAAQIGWQSARRTAAAATSDLPPAPSPAALRLASLGENAAFARIAMLWLQAFDSRGGNAVPYQQLDYARLIAWLDAILATDPRSGYPLFAAARVYAENDDARKARLMFDFIEAQFLRDPNRRWAALAQAALLAKHRLHDLPLARRYAAEIQRLTTDPTIPSWARQMEIFILEDMNELEAAKVMLGGLLATGRIRDPEERRFLEGRLKEIESRVQDQRAKTR
ncbi:MAG TPA: hypothetical protein VI229_05830 [Burkholderiales bacterium]